jgi:hypothetical protein
LKSSSNILAKLNKIDVARITFWDSSQCVHRFLRMGKRLFQAPNKHSLIMVLNPLILLLKGLFLLSWLLSLRTHLSSRSLDDRLWYQRILGQKLLH